MAIPVQLRRETAANIASTNRVLAQGEPFYEVDTGVFKLGDGVTPYKFLPPLVSMAVSPAKTLNVVDHGYATSPALPQPSTSTVGTGQVKFKIGIACTGLSPLFQHWYTPGTFVDTDPAGSITFSASLMVVSSSNPTTTLNTPYRLTFGGRTTTTLDPGGEIAADPVGVSVLPGDVVAVRTYLSAGTAYVTRVATFLAYDVSFTATSDLTGVNTALGSGSGAIVFGPAQLLGRVENGSAAPAFMALGDSAISSYGDGTIAYRAEYNMGGWQMRALSGKASLVNAGLPGDRATTFRATAGSLRRIKGAQRANIGIIEYGAGDLNNVGITAAATEALNLGIATDIRKMGISRVYLTTIVPRTTSTDGWLTLVNQTAVSAESQRVAYNTWVRAGCPIDPTTKAAVAVGTVGALLAGKFGHPITGFIEISTPVESAFNSGLWAAPGRAVPLSVTAASAAFTISSGSLNSANADSGGDLGQTIAVPGAGASGALLSAFVFTVSSTTAGSLSSGAGTTVSGAQAVIGGMSYDGAHPSTKGHITIAALIDPTKL